MVFFFFYLELKEKSGEREKERDWVHQRRGTSPPCSRPHRVNHHHHPCCSANGDNASKPVLQVQTQKAGAENIERCKIVVHNDVQVQGNNKLCYQPPPASTSCTALVPSPFITKKELRRKRSIVANCGINYGG